MSREETYLAAGTMHFTLLHVLPHKTRHGTRWRHQRARVPLGRFPVALFRPPFHRAGNERRWGRKRWRKEGKREGGGIDGTRGWGRAFEVYARCVCNIYTYIFIKYICINIYKDIYIPLWSQFLVGRRSNFSVTLLSPFSPPHFPLSYVRFIHYAM